MSKDTVWITARVTTVQDVQVEWPINDDGSLCDHPDGESALRAHLDLPVGDHEFSEVEIREEATGHPGIFDVWDSM